MSQGSGYSYGKGSASDKANDAASGERRNYPKLDFDRVRGQGVVLQFIKFYRDDEDRILHPVPAYVQGLNYWEHRKTGVIYSGKMALNRVVPREQVTKWDNQYTILFRLMSPIDAPFGSSAIFRRNVPPSAIDIDSTAHTYDLVLKGQGLSGAMRVLIACGLDVSRACDGPFYDEEYIHGRVVRNTVDPLTAEQMMAQVIEPILLEAVEQKDWMVAGKFTDAPFTELSLKDFKACTPDQVALIRKQLDDAGLSEDTVGQVPDDATSVAATAAPVTPPAPQAPVEDVAWQQVTLTVDEIKGHLLARRDAQTFPEPPNFPEGINPENVQMERLMVWIKMVKPDIRRGKLISQMTHDDLKKLYVLLNSPAPAAVSLD